MGNYKIPSTPTGSLNIDESGLKNLAGWISRYKNFGLQISEASPFLRDLLENGTLSRFEPSLKNLEIANYAGEEDCERYEFDVAINDFVDIDGLDWANLHFVFKSGKCMMFIECCNQSETDKVSLALTRKFNTLGVEPLLEEEFSRDISWEDADKIMVKYLQYVNNPEIPEVPE
jgi:hypothetical protein